MPNNNLKTYTEAGQVALMMEKFGGSFAKMLGAALAHADIENVIKIKNTWPELWEQYLGFYIQEYGYTEYPERKFTIRTIFGKKGARI